MTAAIRLLFDECLGPPMLEPIRSLAWLDPRDIEIEHVLSFQQPGVHDDKWIPGIAEEGWLVITSDRGGRGNSQSKGRKLTRVCFLYRISYVVLAPQVHDLTAVPKSEAVASVFSQLVTAAQYPRGSRFAMVRRPSGATAVLHMPLDENGCLLKGPALVAARKNPAGPLGVY